MLLKCTCWSSPGKERLIGSYLIIFIWAFPLLRCFSDFSFCCRISAVLEWGEKLLLRCLHWAVLSLSSVGICVWVPWGSGCHKLVVLGLACPVYHAAPVQVSWAVLLLLYIGRAQLLVQLWGFCLFFLCSVMWLTLVPNACL